MSQTHSDHHPIKVHLANSAISPLFVDRFGRSLQLCHIDFDEEAISDGLITHSRVFREDFEF